MQSGQSLFKIKACEADFQRWVPISDAPISADKMATAFLERISLTSAVAGHDQ